MPLPQPAPTVQHAKIKSVSIWFYIIAAFQLFAAFVAWSGVYGGDVAGLGIAFVVADVAIGAAFIVLGYYAGKRHPWAFVAGLVLYAVRAALQFLQLFSPISLIIRAFLMFRIWQGLQACIAANNAERATSLLQQRRLVMPQAPTAQQPEPVAPPPAWTPSRPIPQPSNAE